MTRRLLLLWLVALALCGASAAQAQRAAPSSGAAPSGSPTATAPANPGGLAPAEAQLVIDVLQDPQKRAQLIETLQAIAKTLPPTAKLAAPPPPAIALAPDSLAAQLLSQIASLPERLADEAALTAQAITDFPLLWGWVRRTAADPEARMAVLNALWQLALSVGSAMLLEWLARRALVRPVAALTRLAPKSERGNRAHETAPHAHAAGAWHLLRRLPFALARLALDLAPIGVFWGSGSFFAGIAPIPSTRFAILIVVNAYAAGRIIIAIGRMLVSPASGRLRLLGIGDDEADYLIRWLRRITTVAVFGGALGSLASLFGLHQGAYDTLVRLVALIVAVLLGILVLRGRRSVDRGNDRACGCDDRDVGRLLPGPFRADYVR